MEVFTDWRSRDFAFFQHSDCEYFPCHAIDMEGGSFNCLFCFCPLYDLDDCGGTFFYLERGRKDCSACMLPHHKENYGLITQRLREHA